MEGCVAPAGYAAEGGDCDDDLAWIHPMADELCNTGGGGSYDDDCDTRFDEGGVCPAGCSGRLSPPGVDGGAHSYAFCAGPRRWQDARDACLAMDMRLARVDDMPEDDWIALAFTGLFASGRAWIGGTDDPIYVAGTSTGTWAWSDGDLFWTGGSTGSPVAGAYADFYLAAADNPGCLALRMVWYAHPCTDNREFICEDY